MGGCVGQTNTDKPIAVHIPTPPESKEATEIKLLLNRLTERNAELESQILTCQYKVGSLKDLAKHYLKESNFIMAKSKVVEIMRLSKQTFVNFRYNVETSRISQRQPRENKKSHRFSTQQIVC